MDRKGIAILAASFVLLLTWMWGLGKMYPPQAGVKGTNAPVMAGASNPVPSTAASGLTDRPLPPSLTSKSATEASAAPVCFLDDMGRFAVIGVCPSLAMDAVTAVAISVRVLFAHVLDMVVPVTTGLPVE
jgi:hypothetical protein